MANEKKIKDWFKISPELFLPVICIVFSIGVTFTRVEDRVDNADVKAEERKVDSDSKWALQRDRDEKQDAERKQNLLVQANRDEKQDAYITANKESLIERKGELKQILDAFAALTKEVNYNGKGMHSMAVELSRLDGETSAASRAQKKQP